MSQSPALPAISVRDERDLLAFVPYTLGFQPEESLVVVTVTAGGQPFLARVDLPYDRGTRRATADELARAALVNGARTVSVVLYTDDDLVAGAVVRVLHDRLGRVGLELAWALRADGSRWYPMVGPRRAATADGVPYDLTDHALASQAVLEGRLIHRTRRELADSLVVADPDRAEEVGEAAAALVPLSLPSGPSTGTARALLESEAGWLTRTVAARLSAEARLRAAMDAVTQARILRALAQRDCRDLLLAGLSRAEAARHVELWRELVRSTPAHLVAPVAAVLALTSWLNGDGALAWCAVERSLEADPDQSLARVVGDLLTSATPPSSWHLDPATLRVQPD